MNWWGWLLVLVAIYLASVGVPWVVMLVVQSLIARTGPYLQDEGKRLKTLSDELEGQRGYWPRTPRVGRFQALDEQALDRLADLEAAMSEIDSRWQIVEPYGPANLDVLQVAGCLCSVALGQSES